MATRIKLDIEGAEEIERRLHALPRKIENRIMGKAMRESFKITDAAVKAAIPREHGGLLRSLKLRKSRQKKGLRFTIFTDRAKLDPNEISGDGFYPAHIETGYVRKDGTHVPGLGFMRGPMYRTKRAVIAKLTRLLWKGIRGELVKMD